MSEAFLGEIRLMGFSFAPRGWARCDGQILPINQNQALFSLLGTTYGGDGRTTFALPDLRGRSPLHSGTVLTSHHTQGSRSRGRDSRVERSRDTQPHPHDERRHVGQRQPGRRSRQRVGHTERSHRNDLQRSRHRSRHGAAQRIDQHHGIQWGPPEHAAVPRAQLLHRFAGPVPIAVTSPNTRSTTCQNHSSARSGCSPAPSRRRGGRSATDNCWP